MARCTVTLSVRFAWWVKPMLALAVFTHGLGFEIDTGRLTELALRGVRFEVA